ncbi:MAG: aminoacyl-tRNA hydrolase [bacterium]
MDEILLVVGLGNPGTKYKLTRHNIGFLIIDKISEILKSPLTVGKGDYLISKTSYHEKDVILSKPLTFMNRSGLAVLDLTRRFHIPLKNLLIILDDFNLPFGKLRLRFEGSDGGHNGLASVIYELESEAFPRLRVGIGRTNIADPVDFVLSNFDAQETKEIDAIIDNAAKAALDFVAEGIEKTMNKYN